MTQAQTASGPASPAARQAPNSQPEPMIEPRPVSIKAKGPTSRRMELWSGMTTPLGKSRWRRVRDDYRFGHVCQREMARDYRVEQNACAIPQLGRCSDAISGFELYKGKSEACDPVVLCGTFRVFIAPDIWRADRYSWTAWQPSIWLARGCSPERKHCCRRSGFFSRRRGSCRCGLSLRPRRYADQQTDWQQRVRRGRDWSDRFDQRQLCGIKPGLEQWQRSRSRCSDMDRRKRRFERRGFRG